MGIERTWVLKEIPNGELVAFCASCWQKIAEVMFEVPEWQKCSYQGGAIFDDIPTDYQVLRESQIFPEVIKAWDDEPTEMVQAPARPSNL